ncbi:MAG: hypothetical protein SFW66_07170 [Gammaproteobacteria bacterium]|nr:hypothetical protein [Gammaproteobacteria bacterium]
MQIFTQAYQNHWNEVFEQLTKEKNYFISTKKGELSTAQELLIEAVFQNNYQAVQILLETFHVSPPTPELKENPPYPACSSAYFRREEYKTKLISIYYQWGLIGLAFFGHHNSALIALLVSSGHLRTNKILSESTSEADWQCVHEYFKLLKNNQLKPGGSLKNVLDQAITQNRPPIEINTILGFILTIEERHLEKAFCQNQTSTLEMLLEEKSCADIFNNSFFDKLINLSLDANNEYATIDKFFHVLSCMDPNEQLKYISSLEDTKTCSLILKHWDALTLWIHKILNPQDCSALHEMLLLKCIKTLSKKFSNHTIHKEDEQYYLMVREKLYKRLHILIDSIKDPDQLVSLMNEKITTAEGDSHFLTRPRGNYSSKLKGNRWYTVHENGKQSIPVSQQMVGLIEHARKHYKALLVGKDIDLTNLEAHHRFLYTSLTRLNWRSALFGQAISERLGNNLNTRSARDKYHAIRY